MDIKKLVQTIEAGLRPDASRGQYAANLLGQYLESAQIELVTLRQQLEAEQVGEAKGGAER